MARRNDVLGVSGAETVIGAGVVIQGDLHGEGDIIIDGTLGGDVKTVGDVTVGVNGEIKANITGHNVTIAGNVTGNINATGDASIRETGHVQGNITSAGLSITPGGIFIGQNRMLEAPRLQLGDEVEA